MSVSRLQPRFIEEFPATMEPGVMYVSLEYRTCGHLCACGCGNEVTTPLSPAQWAFTFDGENISLWPSIGSWALPCQSHYIVDHGRVRWARTFSRAEIQRNRARDHAALEAAGRATSRQPLLDKPQHATAPSLPAPPWWQLVKTRVAAYVKALLRR